MLLMRVFTVLVAFGGLESRRSVAWPGPVSGAGATASRNTGGMRDDLVNETVLLGLFRGEPAVAVAVADDRLDGLAGVLRGQLGHALLGAQQVLGLDLDVRDGTAEARGALVHHDVGV